MGIAIKHVTVSLHMGPTFRLIALAALAISCAKSPSPRSALPGDGADERVLWPVVLKLAAEAEALLKQQEDLIWKNWTEGTPANIARTYDGKDKLFSLDSITAIDRLRQRLLIVYQCSPASDPGARPQCKADPGGALEIRALNHLYIHFVGEYLSRMLSENTEAIANLEASMTFTAAGREHRYRDLDRLLAAEKDPEKRQALYLGATRAVERLSQSVRRKEDRAEALLKEIGLPSSEAFGAALRNGNLERLGQLADQVLTETQDAYAQAMEKLAQREMHVSFEKLHRSDIPRLFRPQNLQTFFPKDALLARAQATFATLGIDLAKMNNVTIDARELAHKNPRPLTVAVAVPGDVRVSIKPAGGARDQSELLHELGHALHYGFAQNPFPIDGQDVPSNPRPPLDFELNKLGSTALTEVYAALFESLVEDAAWLQEHAKLSGDKLSWYLLASKAHRAYQIRRRAGKLLYALQVHRDDDADARVLYRRVMSRAYGLVMMPEDVARYLVDRDEFYESADPLRAWVIARQLQDHLKNRYGMAWWKSAEAGNLLRQLWAKGNAIYAEELPHLLGDGAPKRADALRQFGAELQSSELAEAKLGHLLHEERTDPD
ncbi:MAG TPA: chromosome segregation protein SMC [Myxococcaceae bacterium]|nr:chromosome segregation protein SMC [Myxococcaceae bacterium]